MLFGQTTDIPEFTSFVFSRFLHARHIKPTRRKQFSYYFTPTMLGPQISQRSVSYVFVWLIFLFPTNPHGCLCFGELFPPINSENKINASPDTTKHLFFIFFLFFFVYWWGSKSLNCHNEVFFLWCWQRHGCSKTNVNERRNTPVKVKGVLCLEKPLICFQITVNSLMKCFYSVKKAISTVFVSVN